MGTYTEFLKWLLIIGEVVRDLAMTEEGMTPEEYATMRAEIEKKRDATVAGIIKGLREKLQP